MDQKAFCPVSGVAFAVAELRPKREVDGKPIYFCCNGCAEYFDKNAERVIKERRLRRTLNH